jgi:hypothetical protein
MVIPGSSTRYVNGNAIRPLHGLKPDTGDTPLVVIEECQLVVQFSSDLVRDLLDADLAGALGAAIAFDDFVLSRHVADEILNDLYVKLVRNIRTSRVAQEFLQAVTIVTNEFDPGFKFQTTEVPDFVIAVPHVSGTQVRLNPAQRHDASRLETLPATNLRYRPVLELQNCLYIPDVVHEKLNIVAMGCKSSLEAIVEKCSDRSPAGKKFKDRVFLTVSEAVVLLLTQRSIVVRNAYHTVASGNDLNVEISRRYRILQELLGTTAPEPKRPRYGY